MRKYLNMYLTFFKIGIMTFGGGYAMLPILEREVVDQKGWSTREDLLDYYAIGQTTPGIIAVNVSTFIGRKEGGIIGGIITTLGVVSPSLIIIMLIAKFLNTFSEYIIVQQALKAIRVCVTVLVFNAVIKMLKKSIVDKRSLFIYLLVLVLVIFTDLSPVYLVLLAGLFGLLNKNAKSI